MIIPQMQKAHMKPRVPIGRTIRNMHGVKPIIDIHVLDMGQDLVITVTGGTAHIGAIATAYILDDRTIYTDCLIMPGHREGELAVELARMATTKHERTVAVLVGIHLDHPSKQDIEEVVNEARRAMRQFLDEHIIQII